LNCWISWGGEVKSDLSTLDPETAELVRTRLTAALREERERLAEEARRKEEEQESPAVQETEIESEPDRTGETEKEEPVEETATPTPEEAPAVAAAAAATETETPAESVQEPEPAEEAAPKAASPVPAREQKKEKPVPVSKSGRRVFAAKRFPTLEAIRARTAKPKPRPGTVPGRPTTGYPRTPGTPARPYGRPAPGGYGGHVHRAPGAPGQPPPGAGPSGKRKKKKKKTKREEFTQAPAPVAKPKADLPPVPESIVLSEGVTVKEIAEKLNRKSKDVIAKLIAKGVLVTINQPLTPEMAISVAEDFGSKATILSFEEMAQHQAEQAEAKEITKGIEDELEAELLIEEKKASKISERPPVVTVMGHVDHGKTSILDAIRETHVVDREHGGITQHIGAYQTESNGRKITFLDTPGHEAFTMMRARGAAATDIVILVVAADDGVKPQTLEAIDHSKAAGVPIIIAINKMDKPGAEPIRVKQQLADRDVLVEEFGGEVVSCEVSAKTGQGLDQLLEMVLLVADMLELKANQERSASGVILEARLDKSRGIISTVLVQDGTLKNGDAFIAGASYGKVRAMLDQHGKKTQEAGPSTPVEVMGLSGEPTAGDLFQAVGNEAKARRIAGFRQEKLRAQTLAKSSRRTLESLSMEIAQGNVKELPILLKADVNGSIEAVQKMLSDLPKDKVKLSVIRASTGAISQADVLLASASNALIVGFNVRPDRAASDLARQEKIDIRCYTVIYDMVNEMTQAMIGMLEPDEKEVILGEAQVRDLFKVPKIGIIAGCYVSEGKVTRNAQVRLLRDNVVIHTGKVASLRRFKDDAAEVKQGYECGIGIENYNDIKEGDVIEFFVMEKVAVQSL